jgi:hypothetical protein
MCYIGEEVRLLTLHEGLIPVFVKGVIVSKDLGGDTFAVSAKGAVLGSPIVNKRDKVIGMITVISVFGKYLS